MKDCKQFIKQAPETFQFYDEEMTKRILFQWLRLHVWERQSEETKSNYVSNLL